MIHVIGVIYHLLKYHDALRKSSDIINTEYNWKCINFFEMMGKFDTIIMEQLSRIKNKEIRIIYLAIIFKTNFKNWL